MKKVPSKVGLKKPQLSKVNSNLNNNIVMKREGEIKMKHMLNNKSLNQIIKTTRQLNPIQLKKTIRPPSQRTTIDCNTSSINTANNLKIEYKEVYDFLKDLNMESYLELFIKNGINTEEKILYLNNDNLKLINMPYAHRARFLKKLKEIETMQLMKKTITEKGGLSKVRTKKTEKNTKYEEIFIPKEEDDIEMNDEEQRDTFAQAIFDYQKTHSHFNNQENNEFFSTGINNMNFTGTIRKLKSNRYSNISGDKEDNNNSNKINVNNEIKLNNNNQNKENINNINDEDNKSKKSEGVGESIEPAEIVEIGEYIENKNIQIKKYNNPTELIPGCPRVFFPLNKPKTLCYNCLHMILQEHCIHKFQKPFCSLHCLEMFENKNVTNCNCCEKKIEIINCIPSTFKEKVYYCSPECLQKKEPNENMLINKSQIMEKNNFSPNSSETSENIIDILDL